MSGDARKTRRDARAALQRRIAVLLERARARRGLSRRLYRAPGIAEQREVAAQTDMAGVEEELVKLEAEDSGPRSQ